MKHWQAVGTTAYAAGNLTVAIDEIGLLCERGSLRPDPDRPTPILEEIIHFGRHRNVQVIATAQRPTDIALRIRALATEFRIFQTIETNDLDYLEGRIGRETRDKLPALPKFSFVVWTETGETFTGKTQPQKGSVNHGNVKGNETDPNDRGDFTRDELFVQQLSERDEH